MSKVPDFEQLAAFAVFADHLNLTRAARELGLSQPALHTRLRRLSEVLGAPLYRREGRALVLTEAGQRAARFAREIGARLRDFTEELDDARARAPICLSAGEGALLYLLGPALRRFARRDALQVLVRDAEGTIEAVSGGVAHLGVLSSDTVPTTLEHESIAEVGFALAVLERDELAGRARVSWNDLRGRPLIAPAPGRPHRLALEVGLRRELGAEVEIAVEVGGWPLTLQLVALGVGVAVVNDFCRPPRGVKLVPFAGLPSRSYVAVRDPRRVLDARALDLWTKLVG
ncbi:HTH-type transcriptional regulator CynR [Enhygromyxa salina]|uniref:HTH-type transcriptional regulator CynR n=1 Tax=Enhygromyxa salina TaxID=215803 RepID=A0A2S9XH45_9BACT|nr:LysR family transcriptional regulator [Enhygromyxa salina]PRP92204.1 HTH-type transcriptional regulator CynR [Enhygromyxa salina]